MKKKHPNSISDEVCVIQELKQDPEFAIEYLKVAFEEVDEPGGQYVLLKALKRIAEAHGVAKVAKAAGIPRESLYRVLSPKGNPRMNTLFALIKAMGLQVTVQPLSAH